MHVTNDACFLCLADTYPEFVKIVERMWAENPEDRPPFDIILADLNDIVSTTSVKSPASTSPHESAPASLQANSNKDGGGEIEVKIDTPRYSTTATVESEELRDDTTSEEEEEESDGYQPTSP